MDYDNMTDDELRKQMKIAGLPIGPIVDTTRKVYIRKLKKLAGVDEKPQPDYEPVEDNEEVAEPEQETIPQPTRTRPTTATTRRPLHSTDSGGDVRQRKPHMKKLDVKVKTEVETPSGGGLIGFLIKLLVFIILFAILYVGFSYLSDSEPSNLISGSKNDV